MISEKRLLCDKIWFYSVICGILHPPSSPQQNKEQINNDNKKNRGKEILQAKYIFFSNSFLSNRFSITHTSV